MAVMKFGGTSIGTITAMKRAIDIVTAERMRTAPVVVLSACGGVTNKLIEIAESAGKSEVEKAIRLSGEIRAHHLELVDTLVQEPSRRESVITAVMTYVSELEELIKGVDIVGELTARSYDSFCSFGELLSTTVFCQALLDSGYEAEWVDMRRVMITDDTFSMARPFEEICSKNAREVIPPLLDSGKIVVTQGFISATK